MVDTHRAIAAGACTSTLAPSPSPNAISCAWLISRWRCADRHFYGTIVRVARNLGVCIRPPAAGCAFQHTVLSLDSS